MTDKKNHHKVCLDCFFDPDGCINYGKMCQKYLAAVKADNEAEMNKYYPENGVRLDLGFKHSVTCSGNKSEKFLIASGRRNGKNFITDFVQIEQRVAAWIYEQELAKKSPDQIVEDYNGAWLKLKIQEKDKKRNDQFYINPDNHLMDEPSCKYWDNRNKCQAYFRDKDFCRKCIGVDWNEE